MSQIGEAFVRVRPLATGFGPELDRQAGPGLRRFERQLAGTNRELGRFSRGALVGTGALGGLGRAAAFASTSFIGGAGLIFGIKSTIKAAMESQVVLGQTENAVKRAGLSWETYGEQIQKVALAQAQLSGFDDERLLGTFSTLVRRTGDVNEALKLNALAANIARGRNIELEAATQLVLKATLGQAGALRRLGIDAEKGATALQLVRLLNEKYAGSAAKFADTAAGAQARFNVALQNTQETIGTALLPAITDLLDRGTAWLNQEKNQERIQHDVNEAIRVGAGVVGVLKDSLSDIEEVLGPVVDLVGGLKNAVELLLAAMLISKVTRFAAALGLVGPAAITAGTGVATAEAQIATSGAAAGIAATKVGLLRGALGKLGAIGAIAVTVDVITNFLPQGQGSNPLAGVPILGKVAGAGIFAGEQLKGLLGMSDTSGTQPLSYLSLAGDIQTGKITLADVKRLRSKFVNEQEYALAYTAAYSHQEMNNPAHGLPVQGTGVANTPAKSSVSRDVATSTALVKAQAEGSTAGIKAAAETRLKVIDAQIAFALKLEGKRGKTKQLEAALQKFYGDEESTQGIIDQINDEAAAAQERAAAEAKTKAEQRAAKTKTLAEQAARAREKGFLDSVQIKERTLRTAVKASHDGKAADSALLAFYRKEAHDARLSGVARAEFAGKAVDEQQRENQVAKTRAETLRRGLTLGANVIGDFLQEQLKARQRAAKAVETRLTLREGALGIARQAADLAVARAGDNEKLLGKAEAAERRADQRLIAFYKKRIAETRGLERQGYREKLIAAQLDLAGLKKAKAKATAGYTLDELFKEAGNQEALYGSNIGGADTPLSAQEAHGKFGGIVKTHQTVVVQNFYGPTRPNQAMNDARSSARNLK